MITRAPLRCNARNSELCDTTSTLMTRLYTDICHLEVRDCRAAVIYGVLT
jgi:hypothetical protein